MSKRKTSFKKQVEQKASFFREVRALRGMKDYFDEESKRWKRIKQK